MTTRVTQIGYAIVCAAFFAQLSIAQDAVKANEKSAKAEQPCTRFTVVTEDKLGNIKQGLNPDDLKWVEKSLKKSPAVCYAEPSQSVPVVLWINVVPDTYHGTRVVTSSDTQTHPVNGTVTDSSGNTSTVNGTVESTSTSSTAVPYSFEYGIYTLSVQRRKSAGTFATTHRFQQTGIYNRLYGIPLGCRGPTPPCLLLPSDAADEP